MPVAWSARYQTAFPEGVHANGNHFLSVFNYPNNIQLTTGFSLSNSMYQIPGYTWQNSTNATLGRNVIASDYLEVSVTSFPSTITLTEVIPGDFNDSSAVNAADYVTWRKAPGVLSHFLTSYDVWKSNYGTVGGVGANIGAAVPEPDSLMLLFATSCVVLWRNKKPRPETGVQVAAATIAPQRTDIHGFIFAALLNSALAYSQSL
jgi:hypothetical protein